MSEKSSDPVQPGFYEIVVEKGAPPRICYPLSSSREDDRSPVLQSHDGLDTEAGDWLYVLAVRVPSENGDEFIFGAIRTNDVAEWEAVYFPKEENIEDDAWRDDTTESRFWDDFCAPEDYPLI